MKNQQDITSSSKKRMLGLANQEMVSEISFFKMRPAPAFNSYITILLLFIFQFSFGQVTDELKAFPSAEGAGKYVSGGREGAVFKVKSLDPSGVGSINQAMENGDKGYVVFDVAGLVTFSAAEDALYPNTDLANGKTVLGQSSFRNGGQGLVIKGSSSYSQPLVRGAFGNLIWRGGIFRRGIGNKDASGLNSGETSGDNFEPYNSVGKGKVILDHMSFSWSTDENVSFATMDGYTLQYSIIMEGLHYATHTYTRDVNSGAYQNGHSKGSLTSDVPDITHFGNLYVSNDARNPLIQAMEDGITKVEIINNVFYNWGTYAVSFSLYDKYPRSLNQLDGVFNADVVGNVWKKGPNTTPIRLGFLWPDRDAFNGDTVLHYSNQKLFVNDNSSAFYTGDNWDVVGAWDDNTNAISKTDHQTTIRNLDFTDDSSILSSSQLVSSLFVHVGATAFGTDRDTHDQRAIDDYYNNTGQIVNQDGWFETEAHYGLGDNFTDATGGWGNVNGMSDEPFDTNENGIEDNLEASGMTFPNGIQIPNEINLDDLEEVAMHNKVVPFFYRDGKVWYNPGYELIEVRYFTDMDIEAMTWVPQDTINCTSASIIPEYQIDGVWQSGENLLEVDEGTEIVLSMLPNNIGLTITLPDGTTVGDDYNLGNVTPTDNGTYLLTSTEGCSTTIDLTVNAVVEGCLDMLEYSGALINGYHQAQILIEANNSSIGSNAIFNAPNVELINNFTVPNGNEFCVESDGCP